MIGSPNRVVISIMEIVHQELYMKKNHPKLPLKEGIYIDVFKYLFCFVFYLDVLLFTRFSNLLYLGLHGSENIEESSNRKKDSNGVNRGLDENYQT